MESTEEMKEVPAEVKPINLDDWSSPKTSANQNSLTLILTAIIFFALGANDVVFVSGWIVILK